PMIPMRILVAPNRDVPRAPMVVCRRPPGQVTQPPGILGPLCDAEDAVVDRLSLLDNRALERSAAADAVYDALREAIVGKRRLPGARLAEEQLARQFGVSRTPVREALLRLETERFAARVARRGLVVRPVPEREVLEVYAVRAA